MSTYEQIDNIDPSAKDPLFRRLLREEDLGYLRDDSEAIIGFEVDLKNSRELSGFAMIGIQKHTILAFRSDLNEKKKLVLFPSMDKLFDESFDLLGLTVTKKRYKDAKFEGQTLQSGILRDVVADLTPPMKQVELPQGVSEEMITAMLETSASEARAGKTVKPRGHSVVLENTHKPEPETGSVEDTKPVPASQQKMTAGASHVSESSAKIVSDLRAQYLSDLTQLSNYVITTYNLPANLTNQVTVAALNSSMDPKVRIEVAIQLYGKIFDKFTKGNV